MYMYKTEWEIRTMASQGAHQRPCMGGRGRWAGEAATPLIPDDPGAIERVRSVVRRAIGGGAGLRAVNVTALRPAINSEIPEVPPLHTRAACAKKASPEQHMRSTYHAGPRRNPEWHHQPAIMWQQPR